MDEQDIQIDEGVNDPDFIRDVYKEISGPCSLEALNRGLKDQKAMLELLDPEVRMERDRRMNSTKKQMVDVPKIPRRSITETILGNDLQTPSRAIAASAS